MNKLEMQLTGNTQDSVHNALQHLRNQSGLRHHNQSKAKMRPHRNQSKMHPHRNHSAGGKHMRGGNKTAVRSPINGVRELRHQASRFHTKWSIVNVYPHDTNAFTEGLEFYNGKLYESTGLTHKSELRIVDTITGKVLQRYKDPEHFGEGCTS